MKKVTLHLLSFLSLLLQVLNSQAQMITTIAGSGPIGGVAGFSGDGGPATVARISQPMGVSCDSSGNIYFIDDNGNARVRRINPVGIINTVAGNGYYADTGDGGQATAAGIALNGGLVVDHAGNIFVTTGYRKVRVIRPTGVITTYAGNGTVGYSGDGGQATAAQLAPIDVAVNLADDLFIADATNNCIRKVNAAGIISTFAGIGTSGFSGDGGAATAAQFNYIHGIATDRRGNMYVADMNNNRVRKIDTAGIITTFAGTGVFGYSGDGGPATAAKITHIYGLSANDSGSVFLTDWDNKVIRKVDSTGIIHTIAGTGIGGFSGDGGPATAAQLYAPFRITCIRNGNVVFSDSWANRIRMIGPPNHLPYFLGGHVQHLTVCSEFSIIDTLLSVVDSDVMQTEAWQLVYGPFHGSALASYSAFSTGGVVATTGLSYTPTIGYTGADTFKVRVNDGSFASDTTTVIVTVLQAPSVSGIAGKDTVCVGDTIQLSDITPSGTWSAANANATVTGGIVTGIAPGTDLISYTVTNVCGTSAATRLINIANCVEGIATPVSPSLTAVNLHPNPTGEALTVEVAPGSYTSLSVTNQLGQILIQQSITGAQTNVRVGTLAPGMYFIALQGRQGVVVRKFVKM